MSRTLKFGMSALSILLYLMLLGLVLSLVEPIGYLVNGFGGQFAKHIVDDSDYLVVLHHTQVSQQAIDQFPNTSYGILMAVGLALATLALIIATWAGLQILESIGHKDYFSVNIVKQLRRLVLAQTLAVVADIPLASANTLIRLNLYRINSDFPVDWSDPITDIMLLVVISLIYYIYRQAVTLKQENELTI